jgi:mannosyltransferase OCH1-like enzyme
MISFRKENINYTSSGIPKIIHQTWKDNNIPDKWKKSQQQWISLHPDWTYMLWTDNDIRNHISSYHPEFLKLHDSYEYPIQRADMIRYFILYDYGGVYCDIDMYPLKNIEDMIQCNLDHFVYSANSDSITNSFMISPKNSKIMKKIQERLLNPKMPFYTFGKHLKVIYSTGPGMLNNLLLNGIKDPFIILPRKYFNPYSIVNDKLIIDNTEDIKEMYINTIDNSSTWNSFDTYIYNFILKHRSVFITIGILTVLLVIIGLIYYIFKYRKCKESKDKCEQECKI